jgi:hypothetical protein
MTSWKRSSIGTLCYTFPTAKRHGSRWSTHRTYGRVGIRLCQYLVTELRWWMVECAVMTACRESSAIYEGADGSELPMLVFEPAEGTQPVAGIVMFHGGALHTGSAYGLPRTASSWHRAASSPFQPGTG